MSSSTEHIQVNGEGMELYVSVPEGTGPFPAVVVAQHAGGVVEFIQTMCDRLAEAGYVAVAPELYHRLPPDQHGPRSLDDVGMVADVQASVDYLKAREDVDGKNLGVTGFCMGGRVAYLMAAAIPEFNAAVAYYGGNTMVALGDADKSPFERTSEISCPLMIHFGEEDGNPSPEDMKKLDVELTRHNKVFEFYTYPGAGHAFMDATGSRYNEAGDKASWPRLIRFFDRHLK
jgi:carboxymethylenebutenolidase